MNEKLLDRIKTTIKENVLDQLKTTITEKLLDRLKTKIKENLMGRLKITINKKLAELFNQKDVVFFQSNAWPQDIVQTQQKLPQHSWFVLVQPSSTNMTLHGIINYFVLSKTVIREKRCQHLWGLNHEAASKIEHSSGTK